MALHRSHARAILLIISAAVLVPAQAGFSISVTPLARPATHASPVESGAQPTGVPFAAVVAVPLEAPPPVQMTVAKRQLLSDACKNFLSQYGWTPAWLAGSVVADDAITFEGSDHENALKGFLSHYKLVGERFSDEKGYVIRRGNASPGGN